MTDKQWRLYKAATKDKSFTDYLEENDPNYKRFNFWFRTTQHNIELSELYEQWGQCYDNLP